MPAVKHRTHTLPIGREWIMTLIGHPANVSGSSISKPAKTQGAVTLRLLRHCTVLPKTQADTDGKQGTR